MQGKSERRAHRRLSISLPLECSPRGSGPTSAYRTVSINVSSGGLYFETESELFPPGTLLNVELGVPPGDGHFPYPGRVRGLGEVVRVDELSATQGPGGDRPPRFGVAARFREPLKLGFHAAQ